MRLTQAQIDLIEEAETQKDSRAQLLLQQIVEWYEEEIIPRKRVTKYAFSRCPVCFGRWRDENEKHISGCWIPVLQEEITSE